MLTYVLNEKKGGVKKFRYVICGLMFSENTSLKKHSCQNGLKLLPAQFFLLFGQDF
jgi:hypothetical protein